MRPLERRIRRCKFHRGRCTLRRVKAAVGDSGASQRHSDNKPPPYPVVKALENGLADADDIAIQIMVAETSLPE